MKNQPIDYLLEILPTQALGFEGTQYPMPLQSTFLGIEMLDIDRLKVQLDTLRDADVKDLIEPLLLAAELVEASSADKSRFFITDDQTREFVFMGSKWRAGWVLVLGTKNLLPLIDQLKEKDYFIFTDCPGDPRYLLHWEPFDITNIFSSDDGKIWLDMGEHCTR